MIPLFSIPCRVSRCITLICNKHLTTVNRNLNMEKKWNMLKDDGISFDFGTYGLVVLNRPINIKPEAMTHLWENAYWRITTDGGTDAWFNYLKKHDLKLSPPNQVTGDFDSIKPETLEICKNNADIDVVHTPDQNYTDFTKGIQELLKSSTKNKVQLDGFVVLGDHSGRLDQIFSCLNTLSKFTVPGFILAEDSLTWLLLPGSHTISIPKYLRDNSEICGVLPFQSAKVTSTGLKWNLDHSLTIEFGGTISSSNTYDGSPDVTIVTDGTILWTMTLGGKYTE